MSEPAFTLERDAILLARASLAEVFESDAEVVER